MNVDWIEIAKESRGFSIGQGSVTKKLSFIIQSEDFLNYATEDTLPGDLGSKLVYDDEVMQSYLIPFFWSAVPLTYRFAIGSGYFDYVILYAATLDGEQLNWKTWKIDISYEVLPDNGQRYGGGGGETGPSAGEANSTEFTQVSFDASVNYEPCQQGLLIEAQRRIPAGGGAPLGYPYTPGQVAYIGETESEIKGSENPVRSFTFEITQYMPPTKLTYAYTRRLAKMVTALNAVPFFGFAPWSVRCMGAGASGDVYKNVPVSLKFEVKPNIKFRQALSAFSKTADLVDKYKTLANGLVVVDTTDQFDEIRDSDFLDTATTWYGLGTGVHSGWAIVDYTYKQSIDVATQTKIRLPDTRKIFMPPRTFILDFAEFLL